MFSVLVIVFLFIFILWVFFYYNKIHEKYSRGVNMSVFLIENPEDFINQAGLLEIFRQLHSQKWNRFLFGDPYIAFEKAVSSGAAQYYVAAPKNLEKTLREKSGLLKVNKIAVPEGKFYAAGYPDYFPRKINLENPKLHEEEGVAIQILVRHLHRHLIERKAVFEANLEILVWADSKKRAGKVLGLRSSKTAVFDFFHRIFENRKRVIISFKELKDVFLN